MALASQGAFLKIPRHGTGTASPLLLPSHEVFIVIPADSSSVVQYLPSTAAPIRGHDVRFPRIGIQIRCIRGNSRGILRAAASPPEWYPERSSTLLIPSLDLLEMWSGVLHRNDIVEDARCRVVSASEATHLSALLETPAAVTALPYDESDGSSCRAEQLSCLARNSDPALKP